MYMYIDAMSATEIYKEEATAVTPEDEPAQKSAFESEKTNANPFDSDAERHPPVYIYRGIDRFGFHTPYSIHQLDPRENLIRIKKKLIQQIEFLLRKRLTDPFPGYSKSIIIQHDFADSQLSLISDLRAPQKRFDPTQHFIFVDRLDHVIIGAYEKAFALFFWKLFGGHHKNRCVVSAGTKPLRTQKNISPNMRVTSSFIRRRKKRLMN